jgi:hypothetical protein
MSSRPRPDLNGLRVTLPVPGTVYLVDKGQKREIPYNVYVNLFRDWESIVRDLDVDEIESGPDLADTTILVHHDIAGQPGKVYLLDMGVKRGVSSPAAMDKYGFGWDKIKRIPQAVLDVIPDGDEISA